MHTKRKAKPSKARMDKIRARLADDFSVEDLKLVIDNVAGTPFMLGENDRGLAYIEPKTIFATSEKVETWLSKKPANGGKVQRGADESRVSTWGRGRIAPRQPDSGYDASKYAEEVK
ncbi:MAG: conserved phage C-terminal domain-containing protein [Pseudomonadota bacterium]